MKDEILKFLFDNLSTISYLCVPIGIGYQAYRRIVGDNRTDRRERQKDTFVSQLSERLREMQLRGDKALEDKARLVAENNVLSNERHELKVTLDLQKDAMDKLTRDSEVLKADLEALKVKYYALLPTHKRRDH